MNDHWYMDVHFAYFQTLSTLGAVFAALALLIATLVAFSQPAAAGPAEGSQTLESRKGRASDSAIVLSEHDSQKTATVECGTPSRKATDHDAKSTIERLFQNGNKAPNSPEFTCLSPIEQIYERWNRNEALLVDVRRKDEFDKFHIPGSLNVPLFSIRSKPYLKSRNIVLVNEGRHLFSLESQCARLKSAGFRNVAVMDGGLFSWYQSRYPMTGDKLALSKLSQISPAELISSLHERDWKFIDGDHSLADMDNIIPSSSVIEFQVKKADFISTVNKAGSEFERHSLTGFIVVNGTGEGYTNIRRLLQLSDARNVFYLKGGVAGLKHYLNTHSSLISRFSQGFAEPHRCSG